MLLMSKTKKINMNGSDDPSYRYKMPSFDIINGGNGNGRFTVLRNIEQISRAINHPVIVICKFIAGITGSNYIEARQELTGSHTISDLNKHIIQYIKNMVLCPKCNIPETIPSVYGTKKNAGIELTCSARTNKTPLVSNNKYADKGIDIIVKYLNAKNPWTITKGSIVMTEHNDTSIDDIFSTNNNNEVNFDEI